MPLVNPNKNPELVFTGDGMPDQFTDPRLTYEGPGWEDTFKAAFTLYNPIKSVAQWAADSWDPKTPYSVAPDPGFDPLDHIAGYEDWADNFSDAQTPGDVVRIKRRIDRENLAKDTIASAGAKGIVASFAAGLADPTLILPAGAVAKGLSLGGRVGQGALTAARAGAVASVVSNSTLYATQETMTAADLIENIGQDVFVAGLLGGAAPLASPAYKAIRGKVGQWRDTLRWGRGDWSYDTGDFSAGQTRSMGDIPSFVEHSRANPTAFAGDDLDISFHYGAADTSMKAALTRLNPDFGVPSGEIFVSGRALQKAADDAPHLSFDLPAMMARGTEVLPNPHATDPWAMPWVMVEDGSVALEVQPTVRGVEVTNIIHPIRAAEIDRARGILSELGVNEKDLKVTLAPHPALPSDVGSPQARPSDDLKTIAELHGNPQGGSVGAEAVGTSLSEETIKGAFGFEDLPVIRQQDPLIASLHSPSVVTRQVAQQLAETPLIMNKNSKGIASEIAAETMIKQAQGLLFDALPRLDGLFYDYRGLAGKKAAGLRTGIADTFSSDNLMMTKHEFFEEVGYAMRRGDQHPVKQVAEAARMMREKVFDPLKDQAIELGLLPEDVAVETAASYLTRLYNHEKIIAQRPRFVGIVTDWLEGVQDVKHGLRERSTALLDQYQQLTAREADILRGIEGKGPLKKAVDLEAQLDDVRGTLDGLRGEMEGAVQQWPGKTTAEAVGALRRRAAKEAEREAGKPRLREADKTVLKAVEAMAKAETRLERQELHDLADEITDRILGTPAGRLPYDAHKAHGENARAWGEDEKGEVRGPLLPRSFAIPDELIEDFLESNVEDVARRYVHTMAPDIALARKFGNPDMKAQFKDIKRDYAQMSAIAGGNEKLQKKIQRHADTDINNLKAMCDRLKGVYALPDKPDGLLTRTSYVVRQVNYMRLMGGMTLSAFPDVGHIIVNHKFKRVFGQGAIPLFNKEARRLWSASARETQLAGTALDMVLDSRAMAMADIMDDYGRNSRFERSIQGMSRKFGVVSLMAPWNTAMKQLTGVITQTRMLEAIDALRVGKKISQAEFEQLAHLGINRDMARRIGDEVAAHGEKAKGTWWANTENWSDRGAVEAYRAAIVKEVDRIVVTPGQDKPLWMSTGWGKLVGQFKSFGFAATQRVFLSGLQRRDAGVLNGVLMMLALGELSYLAKTEIARREVSDDPLDHVREAFFRSGVMFWLPDVIDMGAKLVGGGSSRYASRSVSEAFLGPSLGAFVNEFAQATTALTDPEHSWSERDTHRMRRMIPFQNVFYLSWLFDEAERGVNEAMGVPMRRR